LTRVEALERVVQREESLGIQVRGVNRIGDRRTDPIRSALRRVTFSRVVHQHLAHCVRGDGEQVRSIARARRVARELEVRFVNERSGLDGP